MTQLSVAYIGNFVPPHSTENHITRALWYNRHEIFQFQESQLGAYNDVRARLAEFDLVLWTRTGWDWRSVYGRKDGEQLAFADQRRLLRTARAAGVPVVGYHLDIWFGLNREHQLDEPFFDCDIVITADGGHPDEFAAKGINHVWFPPAVSLAECELGTRRDEFVSELAFVGSWQGHYHQEHQHRFELVQWLKKNYGKRCEFYPKLGEHAVRGAALRDLYASVDVVVGDSCFAGSGLANYWSDRIPETLGRGGFLLHPAVPGLEIQFRPTFHFGMWPAGDWDSLRDHIEVALADPEARHGVAEQGRLHVMAHHTYERRMEQLVELLEKKGLTPDDR